MRKARYLRLLRRSTRTMWRALPTSCLRIICSWTLSAVSRRAERRCVKGGEDTSRCFPTTTSRTHQYAGKGTSQSQESPKRLSQKQASLLSQYESYTCGDETRKGVLVEAKIASEIERKTTVDYSAQPLNRRGGRLHKRTQYEKMVKSSSSSDPQHIGGNHFCRSRQS